MHEESTSKIGLSTATIVCMNAMIGSGIFAAPAIMSSYVGPAGILAYLFVVVVVWCMALSLARLATLFPEEGSFYTYTKQWAGHIIGLIAGFSYIAGLLVAMGLLTHTSSFYLHSFFPTLSLQTLGLATLGVLIVLNMFGVVLSQIGQQILIVCTLFPILTTTILCLLHADFSNITPFAPYGFSNVFKATRFVIFGFFGFECATSLFSIVENPQKNVARALTYSIIIVGLVYLLFIASLILSIPTSYFSDPTIPLSDTLSLLFPNNWLLMGSIHCSILSAVLGTIHSMMWGSSMLLISLMKKITCLSSVEQSLSSAVKQKMSVFFVGMCIALSFVTFSSINLFFNLTSIAVILAFVFSMITLLTMKSEWRSGHNIITIIGISTALMIFYFSVEGLIEEFAKMI